MKIRIKTNKIKFQNNNKVKTFYIAEMFEDNKRTVFSLMSHKKGL